MTRERPLPPTPMCGSDALPSWLFRVIVEAVRLLPRALTGAR